MPENFSLTLLIAVITALVGILCLGLALVALAKSRKGSRAPAGAILASNQETPAELRSFAARQLFSAAVMFVLAVVIFIYS